MHKAGKFTEFDKKACDEDFFNILRDKETAWNLFSSFSKDELLSFIANEDTRVVDSIGIYPHRVLTLFGIEFLLDLTQFRGKFGRCKGKTAFELGESRLPWLRSTVCGSDFALDFLFVDLLKEATENFVRGPVTVALKEAISRGSSWNLLEKLEKKINNSPKIEHTVQVVEWVVTAAGSLWDTLTSIPFKMLPFVIRYSGSLHHVQKILGQCAKGNKKEAKNTLMVSLILASHPFGVFPSAFTLLLQFISEAVGTYLQDDVDFLPFLIETELLSLPLRQYLPHFLDQEKVAEASLPLRLVSDISVENVFLKLTQPPITPTEGFNWIKSVKFAIKFTPSCSLPCALKKLATRLPTEKLKEIFIHKEVFKEWNNVNNSKLRSLIAFYLELMGINLDWMRSHFCLMHPVEFVSVLEENPQWTHLVPHFEQLVRTFVNPWGGLVPHFTYNTVREWERLQQIFGEQPLSVECGDMNSGVLVALIRALIKKFGVNETRKQANAIRNRIPQYPFEYEDSLEPLALLLHIVIEMGELEAVEKLSYPGILLWTNENGKNALDITNEKLGEDHPITLHIHNRCNELTGWI